jgi:hypothetical protein
MTSVSPGAGTLQAAYDAATAGDVLVLQDGTYTCGGAQTCSGWGDSVLEISKSITIRAAHAGQVVLDAEFFEWGKGVKIGGGTVLLEGLRITRAAWGGLTISGGTVTVQDCDIYSNLGDGAGVTTTGGTGSFINCNIYSNTAPANAEDGAGFLNYGGDFTFQNCNIYSNSAKAAAPGIGGGVCILNGGNVVFQNCNISSCVSQSRPAHSPRPSLASASASSTAAFSPRGPRIDTRLRRNEGNYGGGVYIESDQLVTFENCNIRNNTAVLQGGGLYGANVLVTLTTTLITGNTAPLGMGANVQPLGGVLNYLLPTPPGHWLPNADCVANREGCQDWDDDCHTTREACTLVSGTTANSWQPTVTVGTTTKQCAAPMVRS